MIIVNRQHFIGHVILVMMKSLKKTLEKDTNINIETLQGIGKISFYEGKTAIEIEKLRNNEECVKRIKEHKKNKS